MNNQQHFWDIFFAWSLALGFILTLIIVISALVFVYDSKENGKSVNPFSPFIRAFDRWHTQHIWERKIKTRAEIARKGTDPDYVKFMEQQIEKDSM